MTRDEAVGKLYALIREIGAGGYVLRVANGTDLCVVAVEPRPRANPKPPPHVQRTGSVCFHCGSSDMISMGGCETCCNCGESVGGC